MEDCIDHGQLGGVGGYGRVRMGGRVTGAHRRAYCEANGVSLDDIKGKVVRHLCDNPRCINAEHLALGTASDNMQDRNRGVNNLLGERNPSAKLTASDVVAIRAAYKSGETQVSIARRLGLRQGYISKIITGRIWNEQQHSNHRL
ncbi:endonuclease [Shigella phage Buco]|uniref:Putative HNH endonuclease n=1 Tax=Shigella phage Buco TaxID=2530183 RepID=A0A482JG49_9CAUD|nr:endonuclease [Shigella phage Buco]QBP32918.1 putative HNH endonuclease [Shigella phage Buco]